MVTPILLTSTSFFVPALSTQRFSAVDAKCCTRAGRLYCVVASKAEPRQGMGLSFERFIF